MRGNNLPEAALDKLAGTAARSSPPIRIGYGA
jgi:hypothetical protein